MTAAVLLAGVLASVGVAMTAGPVPALALAAAMLLAYFFLGN